MLDIVIAVINEKTGGGTKYINRRDRNYVISAVAEENYHQKLTDAIRDFVDGHKTSKYSTIMDFRLQQANIYHVDSKLFPEERLHVPSEELYGRNGGYRLSCFGRAYRPCAVDRGNAMYSQRLGL